MIDVTLATDLAHKGSDSTGRTGVVKTVCSRSKGSKTRQNNPLVWSNQTGSDGQNRVKATLLRQHRQSGRAWLIDVLWHILGPWMKSSWAGRWLGQVMTGEVSVCNTDAVSQFRGFCGLNTSYWADMTRPIPGCSKWGWEMYPYLAQIWRK